MVRSRISSRSNSASAAKMPNTRRLPAVVVSICGRQILHGVDQVREVPAEPVELPDDEHVALPQSSQAVVEARPVVAAAGGEVVVEVDRVGRRPPGGRRAAEHRGPPAPPQQAGLRAAAVRAPPPGPAADLRASSCRRPSWISSDASSTWTGTSSPTTRSGPRAGTSILPSCAACTASRSFSGGAARELGDRLREEEAEPARSNEDLVRRFVDASRRTRTILPATTTIERLCADAQHVEGGSPATIGRSPCSAHVATIRPGVAPRVSRIPFATDPCPRPQNGV